VSKEDVWFRGDRTGPNETRNYLNEGLTLRDHFAASALAGFMADPASADVTAGRIAAACYAIADAMLAERAKPDPAP